MHAIKIREKERVNSSFYNDQCTSGIAPIEMNIWTQDKRRNGSDFEGSESTRSSC